MGQNSGDRCHAAVDTGLVWSHLPIFVFQENLEIWSFLNVNSNQFSTLVTF